MSLAVVVLLGLAVDLAAAPLSLSNQALAATACSPRQSSYSGVVSSTPGLVGYWRLGESSGTVACDSTANHDNGTYLGGVTLGVPGAISGDPDTAVSLTTGQVSVPSASPLNVGDDFTIEAWVKRGASKTESNEVIASKQEGAWVLMFNEADQLTLRRSTYGNIATANVATTDTTNWHYVVATKNGSSIHLYIDGTDATGTIANQTMTNNSEPLAIGQSSGSAYLKGSVDEVALYNTALTSAQVKQHHEAVLAGVLAPPSALSTTPGNGAATLKWTASSSAGVTGYDVYRANPDGSWPSTALASVSSSGSLTYTDTGLSNGTTYTYRVTAYEGSGNQSSPSNQASATPTAVCSPRQSSYSSLISATPGLVGYWRLGESSGATACDSTANHDNGTYLGGVTLGIPGAIGGDIDTAASLDGSSGQISVPASSSLNVGDTFTIEAWVKRGTSKSGSNEVIASKQEGSLVLMFNEANQLTLRRSTYGEVATANVTTTDTTNWHYVVATKNGASVHLYIDGVDVTGTVTNQTFTNNNLPFAIGQSSSSAFLKGSVDEAALYNTALTPTQITQHYEAGSPIIGPMAGELTALSPTTVATQTSPIGVVVSPDNKSLYVTYERGTTLSQYSRNTETGKLTALSPATLQTGSEPRTAAISPDGKSVYVANFGSETVSQFSRNPETGKLTALSPAAVKTGDSPHGIEVSPDGKSVYVANYWGNSIYQYSRNPETGTLTALSPATVVAGKNPNSIIISSDGKSVYTADRGNKAVSQYSRNLETGTLTALVPATIEAGELPHDAAISPDGKTVYVTNSGSATVSLYGRNAETGKLTALGPATVATGREPSSVTVSSDGKSAYVTDGGAATVSQYSRNPETGSLTPLTHATIASGISPYGVTASPDGKFVYVANESSGSLSQYARAHP
jgi:6-phosphogluconolactonase (cycloisomerase 2 family)